MDNAFDGEKVAFPPFSDYISDPKGHYLLVKGDLEGTLVTLLTYYGPNKDQLTFLQVLFQQLSPHFEGTLLMGGD